MSSISDITPHITFIPWGSGLAIKRAGSIIAVIPRDELPRLGVAVATALSDGNK